ncbi:MAG: hypothetical protein WCD89_19700 [Anaerocolumna sp.]
MNYALRNAAENLTQFSDCKEVLSAFTESSYKQYQLEDNLYALPETQMFNVMFYRKDIGFICFPMGPKATDYTNCYSDNVYAIPACYDADKAWKIAFAYNLYTEPVTGYEDYAAWKSDYYKNFRDTESVDLTLARMMENGMIIYHTMTAGLDMGEDLLWGISKDSTPAQQAEAIRGTWASYLKEANK